MVIHWLHTSDIHGMLSSVDGRGGMDCVASYVHECRQLWGESLIVTDGGDVLQGSPYTYYYNNVCGMERHGIATLMNGIGYDASVLGNHDVEVGVASCRRWMDDCRHPVLAANAGFTPYTVIERCGVRIAILGLITPVIVHWLHPHLWEGMTFTDMLGSARHWIAEIKKEIMPDMIVGLFHSGWSGGLDGENMTHAIAEQMPEFNLILYGHDHHPAVHDVGGTLCVNPGALAMSVAEMTLDTETKEVSARIVRLSSATKRLLAIPDLPGVERWMNSHVGFLAEALDERDAYFGPSSFIDLFHKVQLEVTGADASFFSPVSFDTQIPRGEVDMRTIFRLYRFETSIYTLRLTLDEVRRVLEKSYSLWCCQMTSQDDHALLLEKNLDDGTRLGLKNISLNMLSLAGIRYTVDLSKSAGERVAMYPSEEREYYKVAINSYHGNGGGDMLTDGASMSLRELSERVVSITPHGLRHYLIEHFRSKGVVDPEIFSDWRFVPSDMTAVALAKDRHIVFGC